MKKARSSGKTEIGNFGKNAKVGSSFPTGGRLLSVSTGKSAVGPTYKTARTHKSATTFGVIWVPRRKLNKYYKNSVYDSHKDDRSYRMPSMYNFMSGDSNQQTLLKKKDDESVLLVPERSGHSSLAATSSAIGAASGSEIPPDIAYNITLDEKQDLVKQNKEDHQEATDDIKNTNNKLSSEEDPSKTEMEKDQNVDKDKIGDRVDSVFLRSPPPHKRQSPTTTTPEEESCGIKCLYYTLQCCDCVLM